MTALFVNYTDVIGAGFAICFLASMLGHGMTFLVAMINPPSHKHHWNKDE